MRAPAVIVTGASRGIGRAIAERLLAAGNRVVGFSRGLGSIEAEGYVHLQVDVSSEASIASAFDDVRACFCVVAAVNCAGIASMNSFLTTRGETFRGIMDVNAMGTFLVAREAAKAMVRDRIPGRIVNVSSLAVPFALAGEAAYAASKAAVESLTRTMARELAPHGITVNAVGPGPIDTDLLRGVPEEKIAAVVAAQAIRRKATFDDVTNVVEFFLRPQSGVVTGQVVYLGGAW